MAQETITIPDYDLPTWMRQAKRGIDWGIVLVSAFSLLMAWAFITQDGLPRNNATENYVFRAADYGDALQEGRLYPRWSAHASGGYGAPIPHYYPPGAPYTAAIIDVLLTNDAVFSVRIVYVIALTIASPTLYVTVNRRAGPEAGCIAALLYITSPFFGLTTPHILGNLPVVVAMGLLPVHLWSLDRLLMMNRPLDTLFVAGSTSALMLTHPQIAVTILAIDFILILSHAINNLRDTVWLYAVGSVLFGVGAAAFYFVPALLEHELVTWVPPAIPTTPYLEWRSVFAPVQQIDLGILNPQPQYTVGWLLPVLGLFGAVGALLSPKRSAYCAGAFVITIMLLLVTVMVYPSAVWMLAIISLGFAVSGGGIVGIYQRLPLRFQRMALPTLLTTILIASYPVWLSSIWSNNFDDASPPAQIRYEQRGFGVAALPPDQPLPTTLEPDLAPSRALASSYSSGTVIRLQPNQPFANARVSLLSQSTHRTRYQVATTQTVPIDLLLAYFPGWQGAINGSGVTTERIAESGLVRLYLPPTPDGVLTVRLASTPLRTRAWWLSWTALGVIFILTFVRFRRNTEIFYDNLTVLDRDAVRLVLVVLLTFTLIILLFATPLSSFSLRQPPGYTLAGSTTVRSRTDAGLELFAFNLSDRQPQPGDTVNLTLYWRALRFLPENYRVHVSVIDTAQGFRWYESDRRHPGYYPTSRWNTTQFGVDTYEIALPNQLLDGTYLLAVEAIECSEPCLQPGESLLFFDPAGNPYGQTLVLPTVLTVGEGG